VDITAPADLEGLLSGRALAAGPDGACGATRGAAGLYFQGLPLGYLTRKGARLLWTGTL
jgi:16S rRNA (cytosine1407-C5)-methyltransferase